MPWIPIAFSTLRPTTSPRLSTIQLGFDCSEPPTTVPAESLIEGTGNDLRRVADEPSRIEREFEGAVTLTVCRDTVFKVVLDTLNVRFGFCGVDYASRY